MHRALSYLGTLPDQTVVYNGHEYTGGNLAFAKSVEPDNAALARLETLVQENPVTTGRTTIADEKAWNPFMRLDSATIRSVRVSITCISLSNPRARCFVGRTPRRSPARRTR